MGSHSDGLLDELLFRIALTGDNGLDIQGFYHALTSFRTKYAVEEVDEDDGDETDTLFSLKPPASKLTNDPYSPDPQQLEQTWNSLVGNPDVFVVHIDEEKTDEPHLSDTASQPLIQPQATPALAQVFATHINERLRTTEDRIWFALTDHGVDHRRIPPKEFECLKVIAAAGPEGILQPDVMRATGQDKRSVPKRTDTLQKRGLITKEICVAQGIKTSILRFKKYSVHASDEHGASSQLPAVDAERRLIRYDQWWNQLIGSLKKHDNFMAFDDLRAEMGIVGKQWESRALRRCMRRLARAGCVENTRARVAPAEEDEEDDAEDEDAELANDDGLVDDSMNPTHEPKAKKRRKKQPPKARWVRCVRLRHEPTGNDRHAFTSTTNLPKEPSAADQNDSDTDADDEELAELDGNDPMLQSVVKSRKWNAEKPVERLPPQWQPLMHQTQFMFHFIDSSGAAGLSTMDLIDRGAGHFWRRPLEELIARLTDVWDVSQPLHLRHLSIVRDTATFSTVSHYQFRSFENYKRLVAEGILSWEAINVKPETLEAEPINLDPWGFPQVRPTDIYGADGTANLMHLKSTVSSGQLTRSLKKGKSRKSTLPKNRIVRGRTVRIVADKSTPARAQSNALDTPHSEHQTQDTPGSTTQDTPVIPRSVRKTPATKNSLKNKDTPRRAVWQVPQKRVDAEIKAWRVRANKVAEYRVKVESGFTVNEPANTNPAPRKRKSKKQAAKDATTALQEGPDVQSAGASEAVQGFEAVNKPRTLPDSRVAEIEAEVLTLSTPGVYINPPGAAQLKTLKVLPRGRPRAHLIAVMKTEKLRDLDWFTTDPICPDPMPRLQIGVDGQLVFEHSDTALPETPVQDLPTTVSLSDVGGELMASTLEQTSSIKQGKKRKASDTPRQRATKKLATGGPQSKTTNLDVARHRDSIPNIAVGSQLLIPAGRNTAGSHGSNFPPAAEITETVVSTTTAMDIDPILTREESRENISADMDVEMDMGRTVAANLTKEDRNDQSTNENADNFQQEYTNRPILSVKEVSGGRAENELQASVKKVGVPRSAGNVGYNRRETILKIIRKHGGMFGGERELYYPFITIWEREYKQRPDRHTLDRAITNLVKDGRLRKIAFTFELFDGKIATKHVVMEPDIDPESEAVKELQQRIIEYYPLTYLPDDADVAPDLRDQIYGHVVNIRRHKIQTSMQTHFPRDENAFIIRHHAPPPRPRPSEVKLGMTEAMLKRDVAVRKRKREQEERRQERYVKAQQEQEIEDAQAALQTDFQLNSYQHEPRRVFVDRGPHGRGRLSKLQRWNKDETVPRRKTLGLLAAGRRNNNLLPQEQWHEPQQPEELYMSRMLPSNIPPAQGALHRFPARSDGLQYGTSVSESLTLTCPYQRFHPQSGTFSTDPLVFSAPSRNGWSTNHSSVGDQLPMPIADIFREAAFSSVESPSGFGMLVPDTHATPHSHSPDVVPFTAAQKRAIPRATPVNPALWKAPSAKASLSKPSAKPNLPRAARNGIFVMTPAEERRLIIAVVVVRSLTGGLEQHTNWHFVHQIFHYKFGPDYCRQRWGQLKGKLGATAEHLQFEFQQLYLEAYDQGEVPEVDFAELQSYDWLAVVEWAEVRLDPSKLSTPTNELPDLPEDRQDLDNQFDVKLPAEIYGMTREDFWAAHITQVRREELSNSWTHTRPLPEPKKMSSEPDHLLLAKSWVRANVLTPDKAFDDNLAHNKLSKLSDDTLPKALEELLGAKIIRMDNKGRAAPGRNYDVNDVLLRTFRRPWDVDHLRRAASFKPILDAEFRARGKITLNPQTGDSEMMALTNLVATGRCKVIPLLPAINNDFNAPWPRLSKWGFTEGNYKTVHMNKERLHFGLEVHATDTYIYGFPLKLKAPPLTKKFAGEIGARIPLWTDIHGKVIDEMWGMMLMATLWLLVFRPGVTVEVLARSFDGKVWAWELELFLEWTEAVGVAERIEEGTGAGQGGWRAAEWWWLAFGG